MRVTEQLSDQLVCKGIAFQLIMQIFFTIFLQNMRFKGRKTAKSDYKS